MKQPVFTWLLLALAGVMLLHGCGTALQPVASTGTVLYTQGARQYTAMLQVDLPPDRVYNSMLKYVAAKSDLKLIEQNPGRYYMELERVDGASLSGQATELSDGGTLVFLWIDAGSSGATGKQLAHQASEAICGYLAVKCVVKDR